jgi:4-amino-4-deoxy-L-arabinose transferase-like glycosyltransferase
MRLDRDQLKKGLLLIGTVGFATLGQFYFFWRREYVWDGVIFMSIALVCFAMLNRTTPARASLSWFRRLFQRRIGNQALIISLALLLNLIAARSANANPPPHDYFASVVLWLTSLILFCVPFLNLDLTSRTLTGWAGHVRARLYQSRIELALVAALLITGLVLRTWDLEHIPVNLGGDEGTQGMWAVDALEGRLRNPFTTGWFTVPTMSFFAQAASLRLFGASVAGLRTLSALVGTATLFFTYLLARRGLGQRIALFALAALTFNHYHIHFSRLGSNQIADPLFMTLTLWLLSEGLQRSRSADLPSVPPADTSKAPPSPSGPGKLEKGGGWLLAAGLTMGLSWYGYFGSRAIALVVAAFLGWQALTEPGFLRRHAFALALMALVALMAISPLLLDYADHPENLSARFNQVNFFRWLENELARPDHDSTFNLVLRQVWRSFAAFNHTLDPTFWYRAQIPLLDLISGIFFILGVAVAVSRSRRSHPTIRLVLIWFALTVTLGWVLTENPPSSMRMVIVAPAAALLVALGLNRLLTLARWAVGGHRSYWNATGLALLVAAAALNVHYYFIVYTPTRTYGNPSAETATVLARYLADSSKPREGLDLTAEELTPVPDEQSMVYFYGPPFLYYDFGAIRFIARDVPGVSVPPRDQDPDYHTQVTGRTLFIVLRERLDELEAIQARHPYGSLREFYSEVDGRLMFVVYEVPQ